MSRVVASVNRRTGRTLFVVDPDRCLQTVTLVVNIETQASGMQSEGP